MVSPRIREVSDKTEMDRVIDDFITQGYGIKEQGATTALLKKRTWGSAGGYVVSLILAFILMWFTLGFSWLLPVIYAVYAHYTAPEVLVRQT